MTELGLLIIDDKMENIVSSLGFSSDERSKRFLEAGSGTLGPDEVEWLKSKLGPEDIVFAEAQLVGALASSSIKSEVASSDDSTQLTKKRLGFLLSAGLAPSYEAAEEMIRGVSIEISNARIKEMSAKPDLQVMQSVQALDEIDKTANIVGSRLREWYGLHFPELTSMIDDNVSLAKLILGFKTRENYDQGELEQMGYSKNKSLAIVTAAKESRGADIREEDIARIIQLAEEDQHLIALRDKLSHHVEKTMHQVAPNLTEIAGASIGARLIAKAGGLDRLSELPASTIQILGAEKALFRAIKSGSRPPKHGILFQHAAVHSAPKWQRGRIARAVAGKLAIAARIDRFRGSKDPEMEKSLSSRLDSIRLKYKEPPKEVPRRPFSKQRPGFKERDDFERRKQREDSRGQPRKNQRRYQKNGKKKGPMKVSG